MKKLFILALALFLSYNVAAQNSGIGIGAMLGTSMDFSAKMWLGETSALHGAIGYDLYQLRWIAFQRGLPDPSMVD